MYACACPSLKEKKGELGVRDICLLSPANRRLHVDALL